MKTTFSSGDIVFIISESNSSHLCWLEVILSDPRFNLNHLSLFWDSSRPLARLPNLEGVSMLEFGDLGRVNGEGCLFPLYLSKKAGFLTFGVGWHVHDLFWPHINLDCFEIIYLTTATYTHTLYSGSYRRTHSGNHSRAHTHTLARQKSLTYLPPSPYAHIRSPNTHSCTQKSHSPPHTHTTHTRTHTCTQQFTITYNLMLPSRS